MITDADIRRTVPQAAFDTGLRMHVDGRVEELEVSADGRVIEAFVQGSQRMPYRQVIQLTPGRGGRLSISGVCTCPVRLSCKHIAAALFACQEEFGPAVNPLMGRVMGRADPRASRPPATAPLPYDVDAWLRGLETAQQAETEDYPPSVRKRLLYVLERSARPGGLVAVPRSVELKRNGELGGPARQHTPDQLLRAGQQPKFLRPSDRAILRRLSRFGAGAEMDGQAGTLRLTRRNAGDLALLEAASAHAGLAWTGGEAVRTLGRQLREHGGIPPCPVPASFRATLRPYQEQGLAWLQFLGAAGLGGVLADDMGLGKTVQALAHLVAEQEAGRLGIPALVVCPTSLAPNWQAKLERLLELLPPMLEEGRRVLLFSQFTSMLALVEAELARLAVPYVLLTGDTKDRRAPVRRFQAGEVPLFLISLKAGGVGLNLTAADTVIHYDPWWNPAVEDQATDRAHHIGQDKPVFVHRLITAGTIEEKMEALKQRKQALAAGILGASTGAALTLTEGDLDVLFSPPA